MVAKRKKLMILESSGKCDNISEYLSILDPDYAWDLVPTSGHIQSLNSDKKGKFGSLGINKKTLDMDYQLSSKGSNVVKTLKKMVKENNYAHIVIATDKDREGEAIAENIRERLNLGEDDYDRCTFGAITLDAVKEGLSQPRKIDKYMTKAQDSRRILDRVVGWEASSTVGRVLNKKTPMGRVVSQAVKMIVMREREVANFVQQEHYGVRLTFEDWTADLDIKKSNLAGENDLWQDKEIAKQITKALKNGTLTVIESSKELKSKFAPPPFETATMHQAAASAFGWSAKKCDSIAQKLYQDSHVTYIRTDSTLLSDDAFLALQEYGKTEGYNVVKDKRQGKKGKVAQEAHECIRPSNFAFKGDGLSEDEKSLYNLIRIRCIVSQLEPAIYEVVALTLLTSDDYTFRASGSILVDSGWQSVAKDEDEDDDDVTDNEERITKNTNPVPFLKEGEVITATESKILTKKTKKPQRLTQITLGKMLVKEGVGRPSSYANIYETILEKNHGYVKTKGKYYEPLDHAKEMVSVTEEHLCVMDTAFTVAMEDHLNDIANGEIEGDSYIFEFFDRLSENLETILNKYTVPDSECLACGQVTLRRIAKKDGESYFWGCKNPDCKKGFSDRNGKPIDAEKEFLNEDGTPMFPCPKCERHLIRIRSKKTKKLWWICSDKTKECNFIAANNEKDEPDFEAQKSRELWQKEIADAHDEKGKPLYPCPECGKALLKKLSKNNDYYFKCSSKKADCEYFVMADDDGNPKEKTVGK